MWPTRISMTCNTVRLVMVRQRDFRECLAKIPIGNTAQHYTQNALEKKKSVWWYTDRQSDRLQRQISWDKKTKNRTLHADYMFLYPTTKLNIACVYKTEPLGLNDFEKISHFDYFDWYYYYDIILIWFAILEGVIIFTSLIFIKNINMIMVWFLWRSL